MALDKTTFVRLSTNGNNDAPLLLGYRTTDSLATVLGANYFDEKALDMSAGDLIVAHVGTNPSGSLGTDPFTTGAAASTTITVLHATHGFTTGDKVTFAGVASAIDGIPAAEFNAEHTITVVDADSYTFTTTTGATSGTTSGGGASVTYTSVGGGTKHLLQVDGKTTSAAGVQSDVIVKVLGGGESGAGSGGSVWLTAELTDVSTASSTWLAAPFAGYIRGFKTILHGTIATADADVGLELGGTDVTDGQVTITASGSGAGDVDETTCTALNVVTAGQAVEIDTDGASTNAISVTCMVEFVPFTA